MVFRWDRKKKKKVEEEGRTEGKEGQEEGGRISARTVLI